jgi:hypothetical protein
MEGWAGREIRAALKKLYIRHECLKHLPQYR